MKKSIGAKAFSFPTPVWVLGTYDTLGKANGMTVAWGGVCCSKPPCVCVSVQKKRYTYANLIGRKAFTINVPSEKFAGETDYFGIESGKTSDKFSVAGLSTGKSEFVDAPYVKEFPLVLECKVIHIIDLGLHTQFIGEIMDVKAEEDVLGENGLPDVKRVTPFVYNPGTNDYSKIGDCLGKAFSMGKKWLNG